MDPTTPINEILCHLIESGQVQQYEAMMSMTPRPDPNWTDPAGYNHMMVSHQVETCCLKLI